MAETRRDVEFIIRARDLGSRTFREVSGAVDGLTSSLDKQVEAAARGELSASELRNSYRQLNEAGRALISNQGLIDYYRRVSDNLELAQTKAQDARRAQEAYAASMAGVEEPTKKQTAELAKLTKAADAADKKAASLQGTLAAQAEKLERAGIDTQNLAATQRQLVQTAEQVSDALIKTQAALDGYEANLRQVKAAQAEIADAKSLAAFRQIGTAAKANAADVGQAADVLDSLADTSVSVASRLRQVISPVEAAGESIGTLVNEVNRLDAVVGAADQPIREYQDAIYELGQVQRSIMGQAKAIDGFRAQEEAVGRASRAVEAARADVIQYAAAVEGADAPNRELVSALRQAEAALATENRELDNQNRKLASLAVNLKRAGIDVRNLAAAERDLEAASNTTVNALKRLDDAAAGKNSRTGRFLGLRPYELTNLSYQVNDIFTQIASGTSVTQTLAQQGGQIVQIFPRAFGAMVAFIPELAALAAVLVSVGAAAKNIADEAASTRQFSASLTLTADSSRYSAEALAATAHELDVFGGSLEDARKEISIFLKAGLDPSMIERFGKTAQNVADVTGEDLPAAAKLMADGFSGGYEQVRKLDDELNFLTAAERDQIKAMFDSGDAAGARTRAFEIFERKADQAADKARTSWSEAFRGLTRIWDNLLEGIGNSKPMQDAIEWLDKLADAAERWAIASGNLESGSWGLPGSSFQRRPDFGGFDGASLITGNGPYAEQNRTVARGLLSVPSFTRPTWAGGQPGANASGNLVLTDELRDVAAMVYLEAIKDPQAQRDVAAVIVNRVRASGQNGSQVVRAPGQFEPYNARRGEFNRVRQDDAQVRRVLANILPVLQGSVADPTRGATMFVSPGGQAANGRNMPAWADPNSMTLNRYGHQFFTGRFPGDRRGQDTLDQDSEKAKKAGDEVLRQLREEIALRDKNNHAIRLETAERKARERVLEAGGKDEQADEAGRLARAEEQRKIDEEVAKKAEQDARRTEAERRRLAAMVDTLRGDLRGLETRAQRAQDASLDARLKAIDTQFSGIEQNLKEAEAAKIDTVDGLSLTDFRQRIEAGKTILKQQETMAFYSDQIKSLEEQRTTRLKDIADDAAAGVITSDEAFRQALAVADELAPKIAEMAANAWEFGQSIRTAEPNPQLDAFLASMSRTNARETRPGGRNTPAAGVGRAQLTEGQAELNALVQQRNELVANYNRLVELGMMTQDQARTKTEQAYNATSPLIEKQVAEIIRLIEAMRAAGTITAAEFDRIRTSLEVTSQEAVYIDERFLRLKNTITEGLGNAGITALNGLATSLAGLIDGTMSAEDALDNLWDAARTGIADFLSGIAQVLMQMAVMQAVQSIPFLDGLTGGLMDAAGLTAASTALTAASTALSAGGATVSAGAAATTAASATLTAAATAASASGGVLSASAIPLMAAATALSAAAAAMTTAATLQLAANATGGVFHSGGIVGSSSGGVSRSISAMAWRGAPRHHSGAIVGLANDERAAILQTGEEVLSRGDPRNILNGGAAAGGSAPILVPPAQVKVINALDSGEVVSEGMETKAGEQAIINLIGRRSRQIREKLGV